MHAASAQPLVAIACGGTGGHLYPGLAIGESLESLGAEVHYLVSNKEVDQNAVRGLPPEQVGTLPAVGLDGRNLWAFARGFTRSLRVVRERFRARPPHAVLAMGGFTSAPPVVAARRHHAARFLHEANSIPGRANRWLAHLVDEAFVYFPGAAERLWHQHIRTVGMPVRPPFLAGFEPESCRAALGLQPADPVLLVTGGSQGARALNELMVRTLPGLRLLEPRLQVLHLTGEADYDTVRKGYAAQSVPARVRPFLTEMELALGAATVMVSRAGASSIAETAALRVPALLVPLPSAVDNHQYHNARALVETGAARLLTQDGATPEKVVWELRALLQDGPVREGVRQQLARWHSPEAARTVAEAILGTIVPGGARVASPRTAGEPRGTCPERSFNLPARGATAPLS
jgi:UDP-N-acetylglucosamine--N-acetylmuramyl-(pentapeptide) pyrophosphoryl-undecaprenol N-acetylglucosamine transferase